MLPRLSTEKVFPLFLNAVAAELDIVPEAVIEPTLVIGFALNTMLPAVTVRPLATVTGPPGATVNSAIPPGERVMLPAVGAEPVEMVTPPDDVVAVPVKMRTLPDELPPLEVKIFRLAPGTDAYNEAGFPESPRLPVIRLVT